MRVVFLGTPEVAVPALEAVIASAHDVVGVVTQPDRPRGRGRGTTPSPIKDVALAAGLPVLQPESPKREGFAAELASLQPQALVVVAYGHILPVAVLQVAPAVNVHFSLLPRYRGAAPVQRALMDGVTETGVSVFLLEPTIDTGPVLAIGRVSVAPEDTAGDVFARLVPLGADLLIGVLDSLERGDHRPRTQDDDAASPAPKIKPEEAMIDWTRDATAIANLVRALNPRPGAWTTIRGKRLGVWRARVAAAARAASPGAIISADPLVVAAGEGAVELGEVQLEGKRRMEAGEFARGFRPEPGEVLGSGKPPAVG